MTDLDLTLTRNIKASAEQLFNAWLEPKQLAKFMTPGPGMSVPKAENDPTVGGKFLIVMQAGEKELPHHGEYTAIDKHTKLAFSWFSANAKAGSHVTLSFKELSPDETELTLYQEGFDSEKSRDDHNGGWGSILNALVSLVA